MSRNVLRPQPTHIGVRNRFNRSSFDLNFGRGRTTSTGQPVVGLGEFLADVNRAGGARVFSPIREPERNIDEGGRTLNFSLAPPNTSGRPFHHSQNQSRDIQGRFNVEPESQFL